MPTGSHFTATLHGESVADRHRARPCAAHSLRLRSPRRLSSRERWEGIEHHAAPRPPLDLAAGAFRDHRVLAESGTAERTVEAELAQHRQWVGGRLPGDLIARGNRATGGGLHEAKAHSADFDAIDPILGPGREPSKDEIRPEALHRDRLADAAAQVLE